VLTLEYTRARVRAFLAEIENVKGAEFPYEHSAQALDLLERQFRNTLSTLNEIDPASSPAVIKTRCQIAVKDIVDYLPHLGFILRSTNVRNAFEVYVPLLRLARTILDPSTRLILSSEWSFAPHTYAGIPHLPDYVMIGLPASESANPLLVSLAGHELGHALWKRHKLNSTFLPKIQAAILDRIKSTRNDFDKYYGHLHLDLDNIANDLAAYDIIALSIELGMRHAEEIFCDYIALRLFGESYHHAFAFLLSPNWTTERPLRYPRSVERAKAIERACNAYGISIDADYAEQFDNALEPKTTGEATYQVQLADVTIDTLVDDVITIAREMVPAVGWSNDVVERCVREMAMFVPASRPEALSNILIAGWKIFFNGAVWTEISDSSDRARMLREILLKSIEVYEIGCIQEST
jgi:hypothetical protein